MADPNQYNVGESIVWGARFSRRTTTVGVPATDVALDMTTCTLAVTDPSGAVTNTSIGAMRHPETGRYEADTVTTLPGKYAAKWTGVTTYIDEQLNNRSYTAIETDEAFVVSP